MDIFTGIASYLVIWWVSLFLVLPINVQTQAEAGDVVKGSPKSAPANPQIKKKLIWATILSAILWLICFLIISFKIIK